MIHVGIIDDHIAITVGTAKILNSQPDMRVVASAASARELVSSSRPLDVVLLDLSLADGSSPTGNARTLVAVGAPVVAYTAGDRPSLIREAARAGLVGMIRKSESAESLVRSVRAAARGALVVRPEWAAALEADPQLVEAGLSARESQVLALYASGETAEHVAELLFISTQTVIDHVRRIRAKYMAAGRPAQTKVDLFRRAQEDGLLPGVPTS